MGLSIKLGLVCFEYSQMERGRIGGRPGGNNDSSGAINHVPQLNLVTLLNPVTLHFIQAISSKNSFGSDVESAIA